MKKIVAIVLSLVMVLGLATTAFAAPTADLYTVDADGKFTVITGSFAGMDLDDFVADDDMYLNAWFVPNNGFFVEVAQAAATFKLSYGAQTVYLVPVDEAVVKFEAKASAFTVVDADDAVCGDYFVANLDEDDVYYASYTKAGKVDKVFVADKDADTNVLVAGKLVAAEEVTVTLKEHAWVGYDVVNYAFTTVKCANCGKVATLYANSVAAGKNSVEAIDGGWITAADAGYAAQAPAATDKVESAQTFDAGIAMYVGMSVMAAAGSAVVLKKKD